ncbi:MAG: hypothetical protein ISS50_07630 [Anaerolineae bacterium]|nr:hypothetical protein [Anaerolineae bacterium]
MSGKQWEIHAAYGGLSAGDLGQIMGDPKLNPFTQAKLLAAALAMPFKETGRAHYRALIQDERGRQPYEQVQIADGLNWLERLVLEHSPFDGFTVLPRYSFVLELHFELARPYLSRDDDAFYIIDNPVRKDKVFKVPFVAPTSWKGSLRAAATQGLLVVFAGLLPTEPPTNRTERENLLAKLWPERAQRVVLFGNEKQNDADFLNRWLAKRLGVAEGELGQAFAAYLIKHGYRTEKIEGRQGRLFCFPTFFNQIGLEIINPHDRERRVGKNPILFECVPTGASGTFRLLYVPYDFPSEVTPDETALRKQVQGELPLVAGIVHDLLTVYGFGAKISSGFGVAEDRLVEPGRLVLKIAGLPSEEPKELKPVKPKQKKELRRYWKAENQLRDEFLTSEGEFVSEQQYKAYLESLGQECTKSDIQLYEKAWKWWEQEGKALAKHRVEEPRPEPETPEPGWAERTFTSLEEMVEKTKSLADALAEKGEQR